MSGGQIDVNLESPTGGEGPAVRNESGKSDMATGERNKLRVTELDALRGLAALVVVVSHYSRYAQLEYGRSYLPFRLEGRWAVLLFFVVSGFVISMTIERSKSALDFVVSRFARLYPPYWCAVAITFAMIRTFGLPGHDVSFATAVANLTMVHNWFGVDLVDGVYWTLFAELSFYAWILLAFVTGALPRIRTIAVLCLILQAVYQFLERTGRINAPDKFTLPEIWQLTFLVDYVNFFIAGIMFYRIAMKQHSWREHAILALCCVAFWPQRQNTLDVVVNVAIYATFYATVYGKLRWIVNPATVFLGSISYSLYLVHENAGFIVIRELHAHGMPLLAAQLTAGLLAITVATLLCLLVERPSQAWIKQQYKNWQARRAFAASYEAQRAITPQRPGTAAGVISSAELPTP